MMLNNILKLKREANFFKKLKKNKSNLLKMMFNDEIRMT